MLVKYRVGGFATTTMDVVKNMKAMAEKAFSVVKSRYGARYIIAIIQAGKGRMTRVSKIL